MKVNLLDSGYSEHPTKTSGFYRIRALLRCFADPDEQYKHWPPLFGTESYWRWQLIKIRPLPKPREAHVHSPLSTGRVSTVDWWMRARALRARAFADE